MNVFRLPVHVACFFSGLRGQRLIWVVDDSPVNLTVWSNYLTAAPNVRVKVASCSVIVVTKASSRAADVVGCIGIPSGLRTIGF
ncbi:MAG: hypothetical protein KatS3mg057_0919 [Herpetosiphonaceae bacterium]|nr:MAG: hypothetical protein KatS3mg057_0919 [Herpetosiphonaceae bacterium]